MATVAEIILPLALKSNFTYLPTKEQLPRLITGVRVLVNFGKNKIYTGVVRRLKEEQRPDVLNKLKPIEDILDDAPILYETQFQLFEWIASYYMCTQGEVLKAALPAGLKPESALRIAMADDLNWESLETTDKEYTLLEALSIQPVLNFKEVSAIWDILNPTPRLRTMEARGWIKLYQEVEERYKPKFKTFLRLADDYTQEDNIRAALDLLDKPKTQRQESLLMRIVSDFYRGKPSPKSETLKETEMSASVAKALITKGFVVEDKVRVDRLELYGYLQKEKHVSLNPQQAIALSAIQSSIAANRSKPVLLHGITGSGKTHIYIELIKEALAEKKQVLYLLPEITLTKQIIDRIKTEFGAKVGIYHSRFNDQERVEIWQKVCNNAYDIVIGVRSAVFLPFHNLGLIVVDEEHDHSFKQYEPAPRYQARDLAIYYAQMIKCPIILGSATPSFESYFNALHGKYEMVELHKKAIATHPPELHLIDMRVERKNKQIQGIFSQRMLKEIEDTLNRKEQVILFQNRRGYSPYLICQNCGYVPECINCDISLTFHKAKDHIRCHYCGHTDYALHQCSQCGHHAMRRAGAGTERIEEQVQEHFPQAVVERMDTDTTRTKMAFQHIISRFEKGQIDILVGTQMVSKGLDFEDVTLVGVVNADNVLTFPDFRAYERAYQLLTQVSGRAGRSHKKGRVFIQTHMPDNIVLKAIETGSPYRQFFDQEVISRQELGYPPVSRIIRIELSHNDPAFIEKQSLKLDGMLRPYFGANLLGPDYPLIARVRNQYRMQFMIKLGKNLSVKKVRSLLQELIVTYYQQAEKKNLRIILDADPS